MILSILIPTLKQREPDFYGLTRMIAEQRAMIPNGIHNIEILSESDNGELSIGRKRNILLDRAKGDYVAFIDDDDIIAHDYLQILMHGMWSKPDCFSLQGIITWDGLNPEIFEHSIKYKEYKTTENRIKYERFPNHLNCIRADIAKQFKFPEINHGEDTDWATQVFKSGLLQNEYYIEQVLYYYQFKPKK